MKIPPPGKIPVAATYIGVKVVKAWPQMECDIEPGRVGRLGYAVQYEDGYVSWCPADVFEAANREVPAAMAGQIAHEARRFVYGVGSIAANAAIPGEVAARQLVGGERCAEKSSGRDKESRDPDNRCANPEPSTDETDLRGFALTTAVDILKAGGVGLINPHGAIRLAREIEAYIRHGTLTEEGAAP